MTGTAALAGPRGRLLTGNLHEFAESPLEFLTRVAREHGPVARLRFGRRRALLLNDPALIEEVMVTRRASFVKSAPLRAQRRLFGNGLLTNEGDSWLRQRRLAQPAFHRDKLAIYANVIVEQASAFVDSLPVGGFAEIHDRLKSFTISVVSTSLFGGEIAHRAGALGVALEDTMNRYASRRGIARFTPDWFPIPVNTAYREGVSAIEETVLEIISSRRKDTASRNDLLSILMEARYENGEAMSDRQLRDEAVTLFLGGIDTPALALTWCWYLLSQNPDVEQKMFEEIDSLIGTRPANFSDIPRLCYTEMVVKEAMRLFPPAWLLSRDAVESVTIGNVTIAPGTSVLISQWVTHRDPAFFPDPLRFDPNRWRNGATDDLPKFAYFPFGGGPRGCIGSSFAMTEMILSLVTIGQRLKFRLAEGARVVPQASMTLRPKSGMKVRIEPRQLPARSAYE
ncbi:MAG: cytochrome P450 [Gemmatimonadaceae bacterium]